MGYGAGMNVTAMVMVLACRSFDTAALIKDSSAGFQTSQAGGYVIIVLSAVFCTTAPWWSWWALEVMDLYSPSTQRR